MTEAELRTKVVGIMQGWVGYSEANGKYKQIIDIYNSHTPLAQGYKVKYTDAWCAATVSAAFIEAGLTDIGLTECGCGRMITLYKNKGRWKESDSYTPSAGDLIMYDWADSGSGDNTGTPDHVGMVEKVSGTTITVIEGNKSEAVGRRTMAVNGKYIRGYCLPDYASKAGQSGTTSATTTTSGSDNTVTITLSVLKSGSKGDTVKALQILLNGYGHSCGTVDGSFGPKTLAAVKAYQKAMGLTVDGSVGPKTWAALLK